MGITSNDHEDTKCWGCQRSPFFVATVRFCHMRVLLMGSYDVLSVQLICGSKGFNNICYILYIMIHIYIHILFRPRWIRYMSHTVCRRFRWKKHLAMSWSFFSALSLAIWWFPKIGLPTVIIHFSTIFHKKNHPFWGTPHF